MNEQRIDQLLREHFAHPVNNQNLPQLRSSVWQGINARTRPPVIQRLLDGLWDRDLRVGPAFAALVVGIVMGYGTLDMPATGTNYAAAEGLGFNLFSSTSYPLLKAKL